jgi:hypothetical protein
MAFPSSSSRVVQAIGLLVILMGLVPVVWTFVYFVRAGGTPIPGAFNQAGRWAGPAECTVCIPCRQRCPGLLEPHPAEELSDRDVVNAPLPARHHRRDALV